MENENETYDNENEINGNEKDRKMAKQLLNGELVEVAEGDEIIKVAKVKVFDGASLLCPTTNIHDAPDWDEHGYDWLLENVRKNAEIKYNKLSFDEKQAVMFKLTNWAGGLTVVSIQGMLKSEYIKISETVTEDSLMFLEPKEDRSETSSMRNNT